MSKGRERGGGEVGGGGEKWVRERGGGAMHLQRRHERVVVLPQHPHDPLARESVVSFYAAHFHRAHQHAREAERHALGEFLALHGHFEAVAEVDVQYLAGLAVEHEVGRVAVAQPEDIPHLM